MEKYLAFYKVTDSKSKNASNIVLPDDIIILSENLRPMKRKSDGQTGRSTPKRRKQVSKKSRKVIPSLNFISILPIDVLIEILKLIPKAQWPSLERISHEFQRAMFSVWRSAKSINLEEDFNFNRFRIMGNPIGIFESLLSKFVLRAPNIKEITGFLSIGQIPADNRDQFFQLLRQLKSLERLDFKNWNVYDNDVFAFIKEYGGNLKEIDISKLQYFVNETTWPYDPNSSDGESGTKLEKIQHESNFWVPESLATIDISALTALSMMYTRIPPENFTELIKRTNRLERLAFMVLDHRHYNDSEAALEKYVAGYKELFHTITDSAAKNLLRLEIESRWFDRAADELTPELNSLLKLCGRYGRLEKLSVVGWIDYSGKVLKAVSKVTCLKSLKTDAKMCSYGAFEDLARNLNNLESLEIVSRFMGLLDWRETRAIGGHLTKLKSLILRCELWDTDLKFLNSLTNLKRLHISQAKIRDSDLEKWSEGIARNLESLTLGSSNRDTHIPDLGTLLKNMPKLRLLDLHRDYAFGNHELFIIGLHCRQLEELYASIRSSYGWKIEMENVRWVVKRCSRLKWIENKIDDGQREMIYNQAKSSAGQFRKIIFHRRNSDSGLMYE